METTTMICGFCGDSYQQERNTKKFCSDACRKKFNRIKKNATVASAPQEVVVAVCVEEAWVPSKRESVLNQLISDADLDIWKIRCLAEKLDNSAIVEEIIAIARKVSSYNFHHEVRTEVDDFDMTQRMYEWDAFEARTGLVVLHKKLPL